MNTDLIKSIRAKAVADLVEWLRSEAAKAKKEAFLTEYAGRQAFLNGYRSAMRKVLRKICAAGRTP